MILLSLRSMSFVGSLLTSDRCILSSDGLLHSEIRYRIPKDSVEVVGLTMIHVIERLCCGCRGGLIGFRALFHIGARVPATPE